MSLIEGVMINDVIKRRYPENPAFTDVGYSLYRDKTIYRTERKGYGNFKGNKTELFNQNVALVLKDRSFYIKFHNENDGLDKYNDLSITAQRVLTHIIRRKTEYGKSYVYFTFSVIAKEMAVQESTVYKGVNELIRNEWLQKSTESFKYWINIKLVSFGDRAEMYTKEYSPFHEVSLKSDNITDKEIKDEE